MNFSFFSRYWVLILLVPAFYNLAFPGKIVVATFLSYLGILFFVFKNLIYAWSLTLKGKSVLLFFVIANCIIFFRAFFDLNSQELGTFLQMTLPVTLIYPFYLFWGTSTKILTTVLRSFVYAIPVIFILYFEWSSTAGYNFVHEISPVVFFLFIAPYLQKQWHFIFGGIAILSFFSDVTVRSNMINIIVAAFIYILIYVSREFKIQRIIRIACISLILVPWLLFILGVMGIFNVFKIEDVISPSEVSSKSESVLVDSRTSIYLDVLLELRDRDSYLSGLGGLGKTKTSLTDIIYADYDQIYKNGRPSTESGMLNYIQWGGVMGAFAYSLLFGYAVYLATYKSKSNFFKLLALWIAYKFAFSFIEDAAEFNLNYFFLMISIGVCYNSRMRAMSEREIKRYFKFIFSKVKIFA